METEQRLGSEPLGRLMFRLALPSVVAQLVNLLYNLVDRIYIGHIPGEGALALTGLGLCTPVILLVSAFSGFVGQGGSPQASIALGHGRRDEAERYLGNGLVLLVLFAVFLTTVFMIWKEPILFLFGASEDTIGYATQYLQIYLCGTLFVQLALGLNPFITCQGQARTAMFSVLIGAVANIVLDPIFIFGLGMGVSGAALATILSQGLSALWVRAFLCSSRCAIRLRRANLALRRSVVGRTTALGVSPFIMNSTECLITLVFNMQLQRYGGDLYVGSMTVLYSVMQMLFVSIHGFTYGVQPILSYNYGAGNYPRVLSAFRYMTIVTVTCTVAVTATTIFFPGLYARIFADDAALVALVKQVLPVYMGAMGYFGVQTSCQCAFLALGQARRSFFLACLRKILLLTPLAFLLPTFMGVMGIYWAEPISDFVSATTSWLLFIPVYRKLKRGEALR